MAIANVPHRRVLVYSGTEYDRIPSTKSATDPVIDATKVRADLKFNTRTVFKNKYFNTPAWLGQVMFSIYKRGGGPSRPSPQSR